MNKTALDIALENLKRVMQQENALLGTIVNAKDMTANAICFIDRETGNMELIVSIEDMNRRD